ncbi:MAG TPA: nicotinamide-nucleotide adenylyltransferase [Candidatus Thermoplasmatota archaeon]|nr:nicotinamide-nucleotide adenylyltransferase [Candidatus Thermoplasmatota archaeon]
MVSRRRALFIGRFQPFHLGHLEVVRAIASDFEVVIVGIGSAQESHTPDNPFTAGERHLMIQASLDAAGIRNYVVVPIVDVGRNALWVSHVAALVPPFEVFFSNNALPRRLFAEAGYQVQEAPFYERARYSGTLVRERMLGGGPWRELVPKEVVAVVEEVRGLDRIRELAVTDE